MNWWDGPGIRLAGGEAVMHVKAVFVEDSVRVILIRGYDWNGPACSEGDDLGSGMDLLNAAIPDRIGCHDIETRIYRENCVDSQTFFSYGLGMAYDDIIEELETEGGVRKFALVGYSRGGGSVRDLTHRLANPKAQDPHHPSQGLPAFQIVFTGYIDAVQTSGGGPFPGFTYASEQRRPSNSLHHANVFQRFESTEHCGGNLFRGNVTQNGQAAPNDDINDIDCAVNVHHLDIDNCSVVHDVIINGLKFKLGAEPLQADLAQYCETDQHGMPIVECTFNPNCD